MAISLAQIRRLLGEPVFSRGRACGQQVRALARDATSDLVVARVQGSAAEPYGQQISLGFGRDGSLRTIDGQCDCPVGHNCKHVAAALIAMATGDAALATAALPPSGLPPALEAWLARVRAADAPAAEEGTDDYPPSVRERLLYVRDIDASGRPTITPMKATLRKDGTIGRTVRRYDARASDGWRRRNSSAGSTSGCCAGSGSAWSPRSTAHHARLRTRGRSSSFWR